MGAALLEPAPRFSNLAIRSLSEPETWRWGGALLDAGDVGRDESDLALALASTSFEWMSGQVGVAWTSTITFWSRGMS